MWPFTSPTDADYDALEKRVARDPEVREVLAVFETWPRWAQYAFLIVLKLIVLANTAWGLLTFRHGRTTKDDSA